MTDRDAIAAYDALAPHYAEYSRGRAAYLEAVERIVIEMIPAGAAALLDVGAGDGRRAEQIARAANIPVLVLADPSAGMAAACLARGPTEFWPIAAEHLPPRDLPPQQGRFDVITCLWNVLGHVPTWDARVDALRRMRALLSARGVLFLDVNHRHNARAYGLWRTLGRVVRDVVWPSPTAGDVSLEWRIGDTVIPFRGHVFTVGEMSRLLRAAGLRVRARHVVDYATGERCGSRYSGQLLYALDSAAADR